ncbi:RNA polymerase sigma factor [Glaciecola sp. 1036]|uniref:RNA polymerase sigma factor n=1 Tax=Alteromonadaceae TaxID=72275 RepID=UPI003CFEAD7C
MKIEYRLRNEQLFNDLHNQTFPRLVRMLTATCANKQEAEEIAQESLLKIFTLVEDKFSQCCCKAELENLIPLAFRIAKNTAISRLRHLEVRHKYQQHLSQKEQMIESIETSVIKQDMSNLMLSAINHLPPICREVFVRRKIHGKSYNDIANELQISVKTVENHLAKGMKLCRQFVVDKKAQKSFVRKVVSG